MKLYFQNLLHDIKVSFHSFGHLDVLTIYLQWRVLRMLSLTYPTGVVNEPLDELSQRRYDKQMKIIQEQMKNDNFHEIDY